MTPPPIRFRLPSKVSDRSVVELLRKGCHLQAADLVKTNRTYLDTHDRRVLRGGWTLHRAADRSGTASLVLCSADDDQPIAEHLGEMSAEWASDLPGTGPWEQVASAIGERRLLCHLQVETTTKRFAVLDDEAKTTSRVLLERHATSTDGGPIRQVRFLTVAPVRGYERDARQVCKLLADAGFEPQGTSLISLAGEPAARTAQKTTTETTHAGREAPVAHTVERVLTSLREEMASNEPGVRRQIDIEFLHDYRVAARRARSLLKQVRGLFPDRSASQVADELRWLGTVTGPPRDLDVQLSQADHAADDLHGLHQLLERKRADAQKALVAALDSARYEALIQRWRQLEAAVAAAPERGGLADPAGPAADRYLNRAHRRVLRAGKTIDDASPPEDLHDLRKKTKAFRYLLEMFSPLYPAPALKAAVRELKALQDNLGEFQDTQVQAASIRAMAEEMLLEHAGSGVELMAMGRIADSLEARQSRARAEFRTRFERFASSEVTRRYRRMFRTSQGTP
ncbi:MAG TPA: CHAD domain-containing protein [Acidimicrobiales bacterium]|nr:CHAD domain-containing protein [Acidimicrobiales bacterium]